MVVIKFSDIEKCVRGRCPFAGVFCGNWKILSRKILLISWLWYRKNDLGPAIPTVRQIRLVSANLLIRFPPLCICALALGVLLNCVKRLHLLQLPLGGA